jgi:hypothetical protein
MTLRVGREATIVNGIATLTGPVPGDPVHTQPYGTATFGITYQVQQYPDPPPGLKTPPTISSFTWQSSVAGCGSCLLPGEGASATCVAKAADGDPLTTTITIKWDGGPTYTGSRSFPLGASASTKGASYAFGSTAPDPATATASCSVVNLRGETAAATDSPLAGSSTSSASPSRDRPRRS